MDELIKSIKAHLYDKTTSPLFGAFIVSWSIWNYKIFFVLFSSMNVDEKFDYISTFLYGTLSDYILKGVTFPIITTLLIIFVYPYPAIFVYKFWRNRQRELKEVRQQIEDETPLTKEESRKIRRDIILLESEYEKELERRNLDIQKLKGYIDALREKYGADTTTLDRLLESNPDESKLTNEQFELLELIAQKDKTMQDDIIERVKTDRVKTEYNLNELISKKLITQQRLPHGNIYMATPQGHIESLKKKEPDSRDIK